MYYLRIICRAGSGADGVVVVGVLLSLAVMLLDLRLARFDKWSSLASGHVDIKSIA